MTSFMEFMPCFLKKAGWAPAEADSQKKRETAGHLLRSSFTQFRWNLQKPPSKQPNKQAHQVQARDKPSKKVKEKASK